MRMTLTLLVILSCSLILHAQSYRYTNSIFSNVTKTANVVYGTAPFLNIPYNDERNTTTGNLIMDIYQPTGDDLTTRPAIIFAHSGGFVTGNRNHDDMVAFCTEYAKRGYVTITIDYRQGVYSVTDAQLHYTRALYRGIQDGRTAVRFLKANAAVYGIDPNKIYFAGSSAGAFMGLHNIYMDQPAEKPVYAGSYSYGTPIPITAPDLGSFDIGNNLTYSGKAFAVMSLWGAVGNTDLITESNNEPVFLAHGTADAIVPFNIGPPFGVSSFPNTYGSNQINTKLEAIGLTQKDTYFVEGLDHEFYGTDNGMWDNGTGGNAYWDSILVRSVSFFHDRHKPDADFTYTHEGLTFDFTDTSTGALTWLWSFGDGNTSSSVNPEHVYATPGIYTVTLYIENNIRSYDAVTYTVYAPTNLSVTNTTGSAKLDWSAVSGATSYKVFSSADPYAAFPTGWYLEASGITALTWTDPVTTATKKFYVVVAVN